MYIKWAGCPYCGATHNLSIEPGGPIDFKLGQPRVITCTGCGRKFTDGACEWQNMGVIGKLREGMLAAFGALVVAPAIGLLIGFVLSLILNTFSPWLLAVCAVAASIVYLTGFARMVAASKRRTDSVVSPRHRNTRLR